LGGKARWYFFQSGAKSVITRPSAGLKMPGPGHVQITGLAWSGGGVVRKVDVSTDGGKTWKEATLQAPVLPRAHTRFTFDWAWNGEEAVIMSRCTDELGEVQPSRAALYQYWGISEEESKSPRLSFQWDPTLEDSQRWEHSRCDVLLTARFCDHQPAWRSLNLALERPP
jgi:hypothetical protein